MLEGVSKVSVSEWSGGSLECEGERGRFRGWQVSFGAEVSYGCGSFYPGSYLAT
jgi:hypothetical protein